MTAVILPTPLAAARAWQLDDWSEVQRQAKTTPAGTATIELDQLDGDEMWLVDHMVAVCDSPTRSVLRLYAGTVHPLNLRDGTDSGAFDVADWPAGLLVRPSTILTAQWTGVEVGYTATLTVQARVYRRR